MKFVGKTSVAVIKSAILGGFGNELFFQRGKREKGRVGGGTVPVHHWDP